MDRARFTELLDAYGSAFPRWPASERVAGAAFAERHAADLAPLLEAARGLDAALEGGRGAAPDTSALAARILAAAPRSRAGFDRRAGWALAACAVFGVALGYGGGLLAPTSDVDDEYFVMAFEAPLIAPGEGG